MLKYDNNITDPFAKSAAPAPLLSQAVHKDNTCFQRQLTLKQEVSQSCNKPSMTFCQCWWHLIWNRLTIYTVLITQRYFWSIWLLVGNVCVCLCADSDTLLSLCCVKWSSRNNFGRYIHICSNSCRGTGHIQLESDEVVREGSGGWHGLFCTET